MIQRGALARVLRDTPDLVNEGNTFREGLEFEVEDYATAEQSEDGKAFYYGSTGDNYNDVCVYEEDVEEARSLEEMRARTIPAPSEILNSLSSSFWGSNDGFDINLSTTNTTDNSIEFEGTTKEGLHFGFTFKLTELEQFSL